MTQIDSAFLIRFFRLASEQLEADRSYLCKLDGAIGDGDHGTSMALGFAAVVERLRRPLTPEPPTPDAILTEAAKAFLSEVGATVGPLYASAFLSGAKCLANGTLETQQIGTLIRAFADGIRTRGKAETGDKTMLDVWYPAALAAENASGEGAAIADILAAMTEAANAGRDSTGPMIASRGRAARLNERSIGHIDPGAASAALILSVLPEVIL